MSNYFYYERISTTEERGKQKFTRQESAKIRYEKENNISFRLTFQDDASGKNFDRPEWKNLEAIVQPKDTIVFKDICRFTREYENGYKKYKELMEKGIELVFIDNPTISTTYIKNIMNVAEKSNRIAYKTVENTMELLLLVELDRAEKEREITVQRIKDGINASNKKSGREVGKLDKLTPELKNDIEKYLSDRSITQVELMKKHNISRNTLKKYAELVKDDKV